MPITKSAKKALRQSKKRALINRRIKKAAKKAIRLFKKTPTLENLKKVYSVVDKAVKRNIFHRNKAARIKSRLSRLLEKKKKKKKKKQQQSEKKAS